MKFNPRKSSPSTSDKHWIHITKGGYNKCILISGNSCLPNCVGYAWGRFLEAGGITDCKLSRGNARDWYNYNDGYKRGQTPKLGAIICFGGSGNVYGHVAVVEEIKSDGTIVTSNSGYGGPRFYLETLKPPYRVSYAGAFQGFIYNPYIDEEPAPEPPKPTPSYKYNIGDKVVVTGPIYYTSMSDSATGSLNKKVTEVTRIAKGNKHPYNFTGDIGWADESSIKYYDPSTETINVGDMVTVNGSGNAASDGSSKAWTRTYKDQRMKVILIKQGAAYPYACNQYGSGTPGNASDVTGWFAAKDVRK